MPAQQRLILCIDDDTVGLEVRRFLLEKVGYAVLTAPDAPAGIALFRTQPVDAVILDYSMPGMNGGQAARQMRQMKPAVPILMLSAYTSLPAEVYQSVDISMTKGEGAPALLDRLSTLIPA